MCKLSTSLSVLAGSWLLSSQNLLSSSRASLSHLGQCTGAEQAAAAAAAARTEEHEAGDARARAAADAERRAAADAEAARNGELPGRLAEAQAR